MIFLILSISSLYCLLQGLYLFMERESNPHISYRIFKSLYKVAPDKWEIIDIGLMDSFAIYYPNGTGPRKYKSQGQVIYMHTFIGAYLLGRHARKKSDKIASLSKSWLDDIDTYQKKQEEESNRIIEESSKVFADYAKNITTGRLDPRAVTWSDITSDKLFEMQAQIDELRSKMQESSS